MEGGAGKGRMPSVLSYLLVEGANVRPLVQSPGTSSHPSSLQARQSEVSCLWRNLQQISVL